jgi:hypothetical protein
LAVKDGTTTIALPVKDGRSDGSYLIGEIAVANK